MKKKLIAFYIILILFSIILVGCNKSGEEKYQLIFPKTQNGYIIESDNKLYSKGEKVNFSIKILNDFSIKGVRINAIGSKNNKLQVEQDGNTYRCSAKFLDKDIKILISDVIANTDNYKLSIPNKDEWKGYSILENKETNISENKLFSNLQNYVDRTTTMFSLQLDKDASLDKECEDGKNLVTANGQALEPCAKGKNENVYFVYTITFNKQNVEIKVDSSKIKLKNKKLFKLYLPNNDCMGYTFQCFSDKQNDIVNNYIIGKKDDVINFKLKACEGFNINNLKITNSDNEIIEYYQDISENNSVVFRFKFKNNHDAIYVEGIDFNYWTIDGLKNALFNTFDKLFLKENEIYCKELVDILNSINFTNKDMVDTLNVFNYNLFNQGFSNLITYMQKLNNADYLKKITYISKMITQNNNLLNCIIRNEKKSNFVELLNSNHLALLTNEVFKICSKLNGKEADYVLEFYYSNLFNGVANIDKIGDDVLNLDLSISQYSIENTDEENIMLITDFLHVFGHTLKNSLINTSTFEWEKLFNILIKNEKMDCKKFGKIFKEIQNLCSNIDDKKSKILYDLKDLTNDTQEIIHQLENLKKLFDKNDYLYKIINSLELEAHSNDDFDIKQLYNNFLKMCLFKKSK